MEFNLYPQQLMITTKSKKLIYHIFPAYILVTISSILALFWYASTILNTFYIEETESSLLARAYSIEDQITSMLTNASTEDLQQLVRHIARKSSTRITIIAPEGLVLADSLADADKLGDHKNRPEIKTALMTKHSGSSVRFSRSIGERMLYVAIPLFHSGGEKERQVASILRLSVSVARMDETLKEVRLDIILGTFFVAIIATIITMFVSRRITRPLEEMTREARRFAFGQFTSRLTPPDNVSTEIATLCQALNSMADQLEKRISTILRQKNELQTFLDSMLDAVITVDNKQRIISINSAASNLFDITAKKSIDKPIQESIRHIDILKIIRKTLDSGQAAEEEILIPQERNDRLMLTNSVLLRDEQNKVFGVLLVLNDVTRLRRLENIRKDFVANVSHELKTPITSIKGYVETLLDEKLEDRENGILFLETVLRKANHLDAIIDDLLTLSRVEHQGETGKIKLTVKELKPILEEVVHTCAHRADQKRITVKLHCDNNLFSPVNEILLEHAVVNLVVNSIQYSHIGGDILITAKKETTEGHKRIIIRVQDFGIGIGKKHLPRIFERFYRSDNARSRKMGGTGLGLSIVKHITQSHNGEVAIESFEGKGTIVTISLPAVSK